MGDGDVLSSTKEDEKPVSEQIKEIKKETASKKEYHLTYDSLSEGLEPIYFWILDFMRDKSGIGPFDVVKYKDEYDAAVAGGYFADIGSRASVMQDRAMKIMATINTVIRSIINLIYDLREFDIRLETYNQIKDEDKAKVEAAEYALKGIWMDNVDIKRGRGSINLLAQQLGFVTLRDAFMQANTEADVDKLDLNDRVKRILKPRISEYIKWKNYSEKELRKRYNIEKSYLKSQVNALKFYTKWAKPYLIAAQKLGISDFNSPDIVNIFNNVELHLGLFGTKEVKPIDVDVAYANIELDEKFYACIEVDIKFRTVPQSFRSQTGSNYIHSGRIDLTFKSFGMAESELKKLMELKNKEDFELIEGMTETSLKELEDDIRKYIDLDEITEEEKDQRVIILKKMLKEVNDEDARKKIKKKIKELKAGKEKKLANPFAGIGKGFKEIFSGFDNLFSGKSHSYIKSRVKEQALAKAETSCFVVYDIFKKARRMLTW